MAQKKKAPRRKTVRRKPAKVVLQKPTIGLKRLLVPIDFSTHSKNALKYAIPFAEQFSASIDLIYVVEPAIYPADFSIGQVGFPNIEDELRTRGSNELDELIEKEIANRVPARRVVRTGKPFYEILQYAEEENIDLIVIATHGHSNVEHILFGSTAEKVVRRAPCPVLVVRTGEHEFV
ncbi:MAG TPA: universal stress protein [Bacteroidota bacterium]|nr:universal stress protein [Bacteroidota bacterium]